MEELDYWRLCEELNIVQATLLVLDEDPNLADYAEGWDVDKRPNGYEAIRTAISGGLKNYIEYEKEEEEFERLFSGGNGSNTPADIFESEQDRLDALLRNSISGKLVQQSRSGINGKNEGSIEGTIDVYKSMVNVDSLKDWLAHKKVSKGFFFPEQAQNTDFLDPKNQRYAPKLAAAVRAWQEVTDAGNRSPKQALDKWLREHASECGLTNNEGKPIETAIEECSKVANWKPKGGATKTPS